MLAKFLTLMQAGIMNYVLCQCSEHGKAESGLGWRKKKKKNQDILHQKSPSAFVDINAVFYYHLMKSHDLTTQIHKKPSEKMWVIRYLIPILALLVYSINAHEGLSHEPELWINLNDRLNSA